MKDGAWSYIDSVDDEIDIISSMEKRYAKRMSSILSERDAIRDMAVTMVRRTIDPRININTEPDIACPKECPNIMSHDYDLFLFGAVHGTLRRARLRRHNIVQFWFAVSRRTTSHRQMTQGEIGGRSARRRLNSSLIRLLVWKSRE